MVDQKLLDILVCPSCKQKVELEEAKPGDDVQGYLVCTACGLRYAIKGDIPIMLIDEATPSKECPQP